MRRDDFGNSRLTKVACCQDADAVLRRKLRVPLYNAFSESTTHPVHSINRDYSRHFKPLSDPY